MKPHKLITMVILFSLISANPIYAQFGQQEIISNSVSGPLTIHTGDVDNDGDLDILCSSSFDDSVQWFLNTDGIGTFEDVILITDSLESTRYSFPIDLDGDGDLDVLATSVGDDKLVWFKNLDGLGTYGLEILIHENENQARAVKAADLDGDGDNDVVLNSSAGSQVIWFENLDGLGSFDDGTIISSNVPAASDLTLVDIDNDSDIDIVTTANAIDSIFWFENLSGQGDFSQPNLVTNSVDGVVSVKAIDFDGDFDLDILSASITGVVVWNENLDGNGSFGADRIINSNVQFPYTAFAADLDNDGDNDVISTHTGEFDSRVFWQENLDGLGNFGPEQIISEEIIFCRFIYADDIDNDGDMDIIYSDQNQNIVAWHENFTILGIQETKATLSFNVSPSPAQDFITINSDKPIVQSFIFSTLGVLIKRQDNATKIDVAAISPGTYVIKVVDASGNYGIKKFVKE